MTASSAGQMLYTQPQPFIHPTTAFFSEFVSTGIIACAVLALGDDSNAPPGAGMAAFIIGLLITAMIMAFSYSAGACLNPARDFGPRLVTLMAGFGSETFTVSNCWWIWGPWCATITGAITGVAFYDSLIFVGGESPINYLPRRRQRAKLIAEMKLLRRLGGGRTKKVQDLEQATEKVS